MKLWGKIRKDNTTVADKVVTVHVKSACDIDDWSEPFTKLCHDLNLERPVILSKHIRDLLQFSHTTFFPSDFIESVAFDRLDVELY